MKFNMPFDFTVDKENKTIHMNREFDAEPELVWQAWTTPELLDQWWGPKPWKAETKSMDFREGGHWLYAMVGPEGEKHWSKVRFISIEMVRSFSARAGFCDEHGTINEDLPQNLWENKFEGKDERTLVKSTLTFDSLEDLETNISMGFKEGISMGMSQLDELLKTLKR